MRRPDIAEKNRPTPTRPASTVLPCVAPRLRAATTACILPLMLGACASLNLGHSGGVTQSISRPAPGALPSREAAPRDIASLINDGATRTERGPRAALAGQTLSASQHNLEGAAAGERGDLVGAMRHFDRAIALSPDYYQAYSNRALAHVRGGNLRAARADFDRALNISPRYLAALTGRGKLNLHEGRLAAADADFTQAIRANKRDGLAWFNRGLARQKRGRHVAAIADFRKAAALHNERAEPHLRIGDSQMALAQPHDAMISYDKAVQRNRRSAGVLVKRAAAAEALKLDHQAAMDYRRALRISPTNSAAKRGLRRTLKRV
ncbi:MAG: tetratricopeptide repeat protein [Pseudomonadota bacterium]